MGIPAGNSHHPIKVQNKLTITPNQSEKISPSSDMFSPIHTTPWNACKGIPI